MTSQLSLVFPSKYYYPNNYEYRHGVFVGLVTLERIDPNVKLVRPDYKLTVRMKLENPGPLGPYFETLLVASSGEITEGSRSNVFFIDGDTIRTAPADKILEGITRKYVLKAIDACGLRILPEAIRVHDFNKGVKAAFLTGTSIGILPVGAIEDRRLLSGENTVIQKIRSEYEKIFWGHYRKNLKNFIS
jgi:branched-chain amino acid aminotransferase